MSERALRGEPTVTVECLSCRHVGVLTGAALSRLAITPDTPIATFVKRLLQTFSAFSGLVRRIVGFLAGPIVHHFIKELDALQRQHQAKREADFEQVLLAIRRFGVLARDVLPRGAN